MSREAGEYGAPVRSAAVRGRAGMRPAALLRALKERDTLNLAGLAGASVTSFLGAGFLAAWLIRPSFMVQLRTSGAVSAPKTALSFLILGVLAAIFISRREVKTVRVIRYLVAILSVLFVAVIAEYLLGARQIPATLIPGSDHPVNGFPAGQASLDTAIVMMVVLTSVYAMTLPRRWRRMRMLAPLMAVVSGFAGLVIFFGCIYGTPLLHDGRFVHMDGATAFLFVIMSVTVVLAAGREMWPLRLVVGGTTRARLLRAFLPVVTMIIFAQDWLSSIMPRLYGGFNQVLIDTLMGIAVILLVGAAISRSSHAVGDSIDQADRERRRYAEELRISEERYRTLAEAAQDMIFIIDRDDQVLYANSYAAKLAGVPQSDIIGKERSRLFGAEDNAMQKQSLLRVFDTGQSLNSEKVMEVGGESVWHNTILTPIKNESGEVAAVLGISRDITERKQLEMQLLEAQKMEAVGLLAGGIAHDFNNLLMVIQGNAELELLGDPSHPAQESLGAIIDASRKAGTLVQQLLAFSRRQILNPVLIQPAGLIEDMSRLLSRLIEENIRLVLSVDEGLDPVFADQTSLEQVFMNLAVNARDAMPDGGVFMISARNTVLSKRCGRKLPEAVPGPYVQLTFTDNGVGMPEEIVEHIFDPFFTSKAEGTGLGLSIVYGIIKQQGGFLKVRSAPGKGTSFDIFLPASPQPEAGRQAQAAGAPEAAQGTETLLVAEDEAGVGRLLKLFLEELGYTVILARDGAEALAVFRADPESIDMVLLDAVMPGLSGPQAYESMKRLKSGLQCLFVSGYSDEVSKTLDGDGAARLLRKPVSQGELGMMVRNMLDNCGG